MFMVRMIVVIAVDIVIYQIITNYEIENRFMKRVNCFFIEKSRFSNSNEEAEKYFVIFLFFPKTILWIIIY